MPSSNVEFWRSKIEKNIRRDAAVAAKLAAQGWTVVRVWEHQIKSDTQLSAQAKIVARMITGAE
jgi:DNA mismatch endonuclease (patch repair protein)